ncbi:MAG: hypothetical protein ACT4PJ_05845 [Gemmatimonadaceae bacterium]
MSRFPRLALGLVALSALACDQGSERIGGPIQDPSFAKGRGGGFPRERARGDVEVIQFSISDRYTFNAFRDGQGEPRGDFQWVSERPDGSVTTGRGRIVCLTVIGNIAHVAGMFEEEDAFWINPPNNFAIWSVQDNGKGRDAPPDLASLLHPAVTAGQVAIHCQTGSFLGMSPNQGGDIVVEDDVVLTANE